MAAPRYRKITTLPDAIPAGAAWAFRGRIVQEGVHQVWQGTTEHGMTPILAHRGFRYSALAVAWVLHHGGPPVGQIRSSCTTPLCVAGPCLTDERLRQREHLILASLLGIDMTGTCEGGHLRVEHGTVRPNGKVDCRPCDSARRRAQRNAEKELPDSANPSRVGRPAPNAQDHDHAHLTRTGAAA